MRWCACLLLIGLFAAPLRAEVIPIRTGEHEGFSRIVLPLAEPAEGWEFGRLDDGYQLRLGRGDVTFDLSRVFDKIPKNRLAAISADDRSGRLTLRLGCACHAEVFAFRETRLVIDLRPGPAPKNSPFEKPLDSAAPVPPKPVPPAPAPPPAMVRYDWRDSTAPPLPAPPPPQVDMPQPPNPAIAKARQMLLHQLARAGTQGLVDADPRKLHLPQNRDEPESTAEEPTEIEPEQAEKRSHTPPIPAAQPPHAGEDGLGLRARTVLDRDGAEQPATGIAANGGACPDDKAFDVGGWGGKGAPASQIADRRRALVGEFDMPRKDAPADLARTYLHFGFGAEARTVMTAFPKAGGTDRQTLLALSAIFEDERPDLAGHIAGLTACDGKVALWSMLATPPPTPGDPVNTGAVLRNFSGLPIGLRRQLLPQLSKVFLDLGDADAARDLRNAITRVSDGADPAVQMLDARIDMAEGRPAEAEAAVTPVIAQDGPLSPDAMILLIESRIARGEPVDPRRVEAVAALAHENRGTALGARLTRAHALALATLGQFSQAFETIGKDTEGRAKLWAMLAKSGSDEALLTTAMSPPEPGLDVTTRLRIADRLLGLGFGEAAAGWVTAGATPETEQRLRLAQAALTRRDGQAALGQLAQIQGKAADLLRARALSLTGDSAGAAQIYARLGRAGQKGAAAWRAGDWQMARESGNKAQKEALSLLKEAPTPSADQGPLARDNALISSSRKARAILETLLAPASSGESDPAPSPPSIN